MGDETKKFRNRLKNKVPFLLFSHIESPSTAPGYPDVDYLKKGSDLNGKVELKYEKKIKTFVDLRRSQVIWLRRYAREGGRCFVAVMVESENSIFVWEGKHAHELRKGFDIYDIDHIKISLDKPDAWKDFGLVLIGQIKI